MKKIVIISIIILLIPLIFSCSGNIAGSSFAYPGEYLLDKDYTKEYINNKTDISDSVKKLINVLFDLQSREYILNEDNTFVYNYTLVVNNNEYEGKIVKKGKREYNLIEKNGKFNTQINFDEAFTYFETKEIVSVEDNNGEKMDIELILRYMID